MVFPQNGINGRICHSEPRDEIPAYCTQFRIRCPDRGKRRLCSLEGGVRVEERRGIISLAAQALPTAQPSAPSSLTAGRTYRSLSSANIHLAANRRLVSLSWRHLPSLPWSAHALCFHRTEEAGGIPTVHLASEDTLKTSPPSPPPTAPLYFGVGMWCDK